ncbi:MAG: hypothetical protein JW931_00315 [Methanomicrobiaceae archaeon]|nr:hypothetical protein [Methanomicrobiaceae archaeon]
MTFEETIIFYNPEHADEFTSKLKKTGFKTKSRKISTLVKETLCTGTIDDFISLFHEERQKYEDNGEKTDVQVLMSDMYTEIIDELTLRKERLSEFFSSAKPGDCLSAVPGFEGCKEWKEPEAENPDDDENKIAKSMTIFHLLNENGLLEKNGEEWLLRSAAEPGRIVTAVPSDMMLEASSPEKRSRFNINTIINVMSGVETHVSLPPEFSIAAEPEIIDEVMEVYDVDEDSVWRLKENGYIKSLLAEKIIDYLNKGDKSSFDDLFGEMKNLKFTVENTSDEFRFDLDEKFLKGMLGDMKRMNLIKSKGNRFKTA